MEKFWELGWPGIAMNRQTEDSGWDRVDDELQRRMRPEVPGTATSGRAGAAAPVVPSRSVSGYMVPADRWRDGLSTDWTNPLREPAETGFQGGAVRAGAERPDAVSGESVRTPEGYVPPVSRPDTLTNFWDGLGQWGDRWKNDMQYNVGRFQRWAGSESETRRAIPDVLPELEAMYEAGASTLQERIREMENWMRRSEDALREAEWDEGVDPERKASLREALETTRGRYYVLGRIHDRLRSGTEREALRDELTDFVRHGGPGEQRMAASRHQRERFKPTSGWASAAELGGGILQQAVPVAAAAFSGPVGAALGAANLASLSAQTHAQAQMDVDRYEQEQETAVSSGARAGYVAAATGIDLLLQQAMQGRYLGNATAPARRLFSHRMLQEMVEDPALLRRVSPAADAYKRRVLGAALHGLGRDMALEGGTEAVSSGVRDVARGFYDEVDGVPAWDEIAGRAGEAAVAGAAFGGATGGLSRAVGARAMARQRDRKGLVSTAFWNGEPVEVLGLNRRGGTDVRTASGRVTTVPETDLAGLHTMTADRFARGGEPVAADVPAPRAGKPYLDEVGTEWLDAVRVPDGKGGEQPLSPEMRKKMEADFRRQVLERYDVGRFVEPGEQPGLLRPETLEGVSTVPGRSKSVSPSELAERRNRVEAMARELGVDVDVYDTQADVPEAVRSRMEPGATYRSFFTPDDGRVAVILDRAANDAELQNALLHEAVGHKGMRALLGKDADLYYDRIFSAMPPEDQQLFLNRNNGSPRMAAEEYLAEVAGRGVENPPFWERAKAGSREVLRRRLGMDLNMGENDYRYLLWKARNGVRADDSLEGMIRKAREEAQVRERLYPPKE